MDSINGFAIQSLVMVDQMKRLPSSVREKKGERKEKEQKTKVRKKQKGRKSKKKKTVRGKKK